jgi:hypothetical protein
MDATIGVSVVVSVIVVVEAAVEAVAVAVVVAMTSDEEGSGVVVCMRGEQIEEIVEKREVIAVSVVDMTIAPAMFGVIKRPAPVTPAVTFGVTCCTGSPPCWRRSPAVVATSTKCS